MKVGGRCCVSVMDIENIIGETDHMIVDLVAVIHVEDAINTTDNIQGHVLIPVTGKRVSSIEIIVNILHEECVH